MAIIDQEVIVVKDVQTAEIRSTESTFQLIDCSKHRSQSIESLNYNYDPLFLLLPLRSSC